MSATDLPKSVGSITSYSCDMRPCPWLSILRSSRLLPAQEGLRHNHRSKARYCSTCSRVLKSTKYEPASRYIYRLKNCAQKEIRVEVAAIGFQLEVACN